MTEEIKNVHREPHPFVGVTHIMGFVGKTIAFVGRVDRIEENTLFMKTAGGQEVRIIRFKNDGRLGSGSVAEIRGIVNKDTTISFGEYTLYDNEFDMQAYEHMLDYYHGMCKELCVK